MTANTSSAKKNRALRTGRATWLTAVATICLCSVVVWMLVQLRMDEWKSAETTARNMVRLIRQDIERTIESYDLSLIGAIQGLALPGIDTVSPAIKDAAIFDNSIRGKFMSTVLVLDSAGNVILQSGNPNPPILNNADRDYFIAHRERDDVGLFLSKPYISRISGAPVVALSRRLSNLDGSFAGIVVGNLRLSYLRDLLGKLSLTPHSSISVFRRDGTLLMRTPAIEGAGARNIAGSETYRNATSSRSGVFVATAAFDGFKRLYAFEHVNAAPIFVNVAWSVDDLLADWWVRAIQVGLIVLGLGGITVWLMLRSERDVQRRAIAETKLKDALEETARLSRTDGLTGLANRRRFDELLATELLDLRRSLKPLTLLMIDADCFKAYNDHNGHQAGDEVLKAIAGCLAASIRRPRDIACRVGGEEFAVVLPNTSAKGGYEVASAVRSALTERAIPHPKSATGIVTVSIGIATVQPGDENDAAGVYSMADSALYEAKKSGRNRIRTIEMASAKAHRA